MRQTVPARTSDVSVCPSAGREEEDRTDAPEPGPRLAEPVEASQDNLGLASLGGGSHSLSVLLPLSSLHSLLVHFSLFNFIILGYLRLSHLLLLPSLRNEQRAGKVPLERVTEREPDHKPYLLA